MVRVRFLEVIEHGFSTAFTRYEPGQIAEVPADLAARWLDAGRIEMAPAPPAPPVVPPEPPRAPVAEPDSKPAARRKASRKRR